MVAVSFILLLYTVDVHLHGAVRYGLVSEATTTIRRMSKKENKRASPKPLDGVKSNTIVTHTLIGCRYRKSPVIIVSKQKIAKTWLLDFVLASTIRRNLGHPALLIQMCEEEIVHFAIFTLEKPSNDPFSCRPKLYIWCDTKAQQITIVIIIRVTDKLSAKSVCSSPFDFYF